MNLNALAAVLAIPLFAAAVLAALPGYQLTAKLNVLASLLTFLAAISLFVIEPRSGDYLLVDDLNKVFIVLTTFVAFTTSVFSASYIGHEIEIGRLKPAYVRFYHAMYQVLMFAMNLALLANNIGLMWVAIEIATLTTVLMVGIYRTHEALAASGSHSPCSSRSWSTWRRSPSSAKAFTPWCGPCSSCTPRNSIQRSLMSPSFFSCLVTGPR